MPSVGMRRSTRVFVPKSVVKDADARVLRSGKRLWFESGTGKPARGGEGDEWFRLLDNSGEAADVPCYKSNGWHKIVPEPDVAVTGSDGEMVLQESVNKAIESDGGRDRMRGIAYSRKRRRSPEYKCVSSSQLENRVPEDRMYGIPFFRKHRRKKPEGSSLTKLSNGAGISENNDCLGLVEDLASEVDLLGRDVSLNVVHGTMLAVVVESSSSARRFTSFLVSVLSCMRTSRVRLSELAAFMCSEPITGVFSQHGIHFLPDLSSRISRKNDISSVGICKILGTRQSIPLFFLDFLAVPPAFLSLHSSIAFRSQHLSDVLVSYLMGLFTKDHEVSANKKCLTCIPTEVDLYGSKVMGSGNTSMKRRKVDFVVGASELARRTGSSRHSVNSLDVQKRSSLRSVRVKKPLLMDLHPGILHPDANSLIKVNHSVDKKCGLGADVFSVGGGCTSLSTSGSNHKQRKSFKKTAGNNIKELKSTLLEFRQNMDSICCSANILVIESDKSYREEGATVMLECSASKEYYITVRRFGLIRFIHKAQYMMRPSTTNHFTHAMIWAGENGWKLEFLDRRDWIIFKELHRECIDRNVRAASVRTIPVPAVHEVPGYGDIQYVPFVRPDTYITMHRDEVERALRSKTANYDMDSADEDWLQKLNNDFCDGDNGGLNHVSAENFEEMVDVFEKAAYCSLDDIFDENRAANLCPDLGRRDMVGAVHPYWLKKRKQKRSALLRVFQCWTPRSTQIIQKPFLRRRRSSKRQVCPSGRGKQRFFLRALAVEHDQDMRRLQQAESSSSKSFDSAVLKRKRAQLLMANADLAAYKATVAVKIAEAVRVAESPDAAVSCILD